MAIFEVHSARLWGGRFSAAINSGDAANEHINDFRARQVRWNMPEIDVVFKVASGLRRVDCLVVNANVNYGDLVDCKLTSTRSEGMAMVSADVASLCLQRMWKAGLQKEMSDKIKYFDLAKYSLG